MAPEVLSDDPRFSVKSDIYSLGCLIYSLCSSRLPPSLSQLNNNVPEIPAIYPKRLREIIARCMQPNVDSRPNSREAANEISDAYMDILEDDKFGYMKAKLKDSISNSVASVQNYNQGLRQAFDDANRGGGNAIKVDLHDENEREIVTKNSIDRPGLEIYERENRLRSESLNNSLRDALYRSNATDMKRLIKKGADVNIDAFDELGKQENWTLRPSFTTYGLQAAQRIVRDNYFAKDLNLLQYAVISGSVDCLSVLFENKAKFERKSPWENPLFFAARMDRAAVIPLLVNEYGFDVKHKDDSGMSAIQMAREWGSFRALEALLKLK
ncbi:hypothetical protein AA313_de0203058 [Arthrobotrys entomopaga]|nr:hypothetical protein AA313_de0203058 [Arthrobotrys entomopaga]